MKKIENCVVENCIPTPSSCVEWNGGNLEYLGICNGDSLNNIVVEIISKLQELVDEDLASFDLDSLLEICNQRAPLDVNLTSILTVLKNNDICIKEYIDNLTERLNEISQEQGVTVNLKCYADFDNLGNSLNLTRAQLDQLVIDNLCLHKQKIESLEGNVVLLQNQIDNIDINTTVDELSFGTCVEPDVLPTSTQVINTSQAHCDLEAATGTPADVSSALANTPSGMNAEFGLLPGWILSPGNLAENYNNLLIAFGNVWSRLQNIEDTCCAIDCDDVKVGFSVVYNEDGDGIIVRFTSGAGTNIPFGWTGANSTVLITDVDDNTIEETITIANNSEHEIIISGLNTSGTLDVTVTAVMTDGVLTCQKCIKRTLSGGACDFCQICAEGAEGSSVIIVYKSSNTGSVVEQSSTTTTTTEATTTTTTSTTTTTTSA